MSMPISRSKIAVVKKLLREYIDEGDLPRDTGLEGRFLCEYRISDDFGSRGD